MYHFQAQLPVPTCQDQSVSKLAEYAFIYLLAPHKAIKREILQDKGV